MHMCVYPETINYFHVIYVNPAQQVEQVCYILKGNKVRTTMMPHVRERLTYYWQQ